MSNWSTSNYRQRKAARRAKIEPQWHTNPETQEKFLIRPIGGLAYALRGALPEGLMREAVEGWKEQGVEVDGSTDQTGSVGPKQIADTNRNVEFMARVVVDALVEPKVVDKAAADNEIELSDLDDSDVWFIFRTATKPGGPIPLQGGQVSSVDNLTRFPKKAGRRARTGTSG